MSTPETFEAMLAGQMPEMYEAIVAEVVDVEFTWTGACDRCGCGVAPEYQGDHRKFHRNLTLGINFAQQITIEMAARFKDVLDEMDSADLEALLKRRAAALAAEEESP